MVKPELQRGRALPGALASHYDPRCDTSSPQLKMHNQTELDSEGFSCPLIASNVGWLKAAVFFFKLIAAAVFVWRLPLEDLRQWRIEHQEDREEAAGTLELSWEQWTEVHEALAGHLGMPKYHFDPIESAFPLTYDAFRAADMFGVSTFFNTATWGSMRTAWLALQCAVGHHEKCGFPKGYTLANLIGERYTSQYGTAGEMFKASEIVHPSNPRVEKFLNTF